MEFDFGPTKSIYLTIYLTIYLSIYLSIYLNAESKMIEGWRSSRDVSVGSGGNLSKNNPV